MVDIKDKNREKPISRGSYPSDYIKIGGDDENFKIFVSEGVIEDVKGYLSSDKSKELGGVLLGDIILDEFDNKFIVISEVIIACFTEANVTRLTFTHKSWEDINNKIDKEFPDKRVLGWFHSHPGHTVFLSSYDKFIQENFFNQDFMVAYVYDPVNNDDGFFLWKENTIVKADCYYIYSDYQINKERINISKTDIEAEKKTKGSNPLLIFILIISIISLVLSLVLLIKYFDLNDKVLESRDVNNKIKELKEENSKTNSRIDKLLSGFGSTVDSNKNVSNNFVKYQIKPGDTLRKLAVIYYKDEGKYNLLIRYNNLKDENDIAVGQIIEIPIER
ncbi:MAG: LysM peptidoglycan-binding domain-containing protein [Ignavibacteriae bacterium]|nr:LysM peptidoglycan-binding domain-containing protein [Ignavibacteriota bacterium]